MAVWGAGARPNTMKITDSDERSQELENLLGQMFITKFQDKRLDKKLYDHLTNYQPNKHSSSFVIEVEKKKYLIQAAVYDITPVIEETPTEPVESESESEPQETTAAEPEHGYSETGHFP